MTSGFRQPITDAESMIDRVGRAIAVADAGDFEAEPSRYRRFAAAALEPLLSLTDDMIDAAQEAIAPGSKWAITSREDFRRAVEAMISSALKSRRNG